MNKSSLSAKIIIIALIAFAIPAALFYYFDSRDTAQLNETQEKISHAESQKEIDVVKDQGIKKMEDVFPGINYFAPENIEKKYSSLTTSSTLKNGQYTGKKGLSKISQYFLKETKSFSADIALLSTAGTVIETNKAALKEAEFKTNSNFLQTVSSKKTNFELNFGAGSEYFMAITDGRDRLAAVLYVKEPSMDAAGAFRKNTMSPKGSNFVIDSSGNMLLNTDQARENSENILSNADIKIVINEAGDDTAVREGSYNNLKGLIIYKKIDSLNSIVCLFTPYIDYKFAQKKMKQYELSMLDTSSFSGIPVYAFLIIAVLIAVFGGIWASDAPYAPLKKVVRALTHIDEESFQELLPKSKKGEYKKLLDSLLILRGRVKASEEKAEKLSQMSRELEEELSKEASKSDMEISQLRDALKIAENNKGTLDDELSKVKADSSRVKTDMETKFESEKSQLNLKIGGLEKDIEKLKAEVKKAAESKVPLEKENMRMDSVLMMNTELKGVLSVIKTYISSVLGGEGKITDAQQQFLGVVINKSARLERLINDLTELARLEKGDAQAPGHPVEINTVVQDVIFAIQPQADIKKVDLKVNFSPALSIATGDTSKLSSVISQLLNQAIKVSPRGGQVIVETKESGKDLVIRITDFGMSMPQSKSSILFVNFHGPESTAGPEFINSGLRFPILKAIIDNMGGKIWIESEIGKGKTFVISLPKSGAEAARPKTVTSVPAGLTGQPKENAAPAAAEAVKKPAPPAFSPPAGGSFKIQRNNFEEKHPDTASNKNDITSVNDLLSFDNLSVHDTDRKASLPGTDVNVPENLMKKPAAAIDELPPLPDLEDDKGAV
jgi:signal transduction histidine kinase